MKKLVLLITILSAKAQTSVYYSFPDSNAYWCQTMQWFDGTCDHNYNFTSSFCNDTIINSMTYHQIQESGFEYSSLCMSGGYNYWCCLPIREDSSQRKVYYYDNFNQVEKMMYDFNLQIGDTLDATKVIWGSPNYIHIVTSVDSILINGQYRKRFNYSGPFTSGCSDSSIIEGIGGISGLRSGPSTCFEYFASLISFEKNGIGMYPDSAANCSVISGIKNIVTDNYLHIYPNPATDKINVTLNSNEVSEIILYDISSRKLLQQQFTSSVTLNMEQFANGIYIYEVRDKNGWCRKGKVLKE